MEIELGLIGAFTLMGAAVQLRILKILQFKLKEITREQKRLDDELEAQAASRFTMTTKELADWEKEHGRVDSQFSGLPLLREQDAQSPSTEEGSTLLGNQRRSRYHSGVSEFMSASNGDEKHLAGALPAMDLGADLEADLPRDFVTERTSPTSNNKSLPTDDDLKKKELMAEINNIRKSIEHLRSSTPGGSSFEGETRSRHQSFTSRRTLSLGFVDALEPPSRPPRGPDPRTRVHSMEMARLSQSMDKLAAGESISRPSSAPQDDVNWTAYVRERKLFQPPAGISTPIPTTAIAPQPVRASMAVPEAVTEALVRRKQRESAFDTGEFGALAQHGRSGSHTSSDDRPLSKMMSSPPPKAATTSKVPVTILPPRKPEQSQQARPTASRTRTFEELAERHREKMRDLQAPLTRAEREQTALADARGRWERSKEVEKQVMAKREAEKAAVVKQRQEDKDDRRQSSRAQHERSLSTDRLNKLPGTNERSGKRQSMLKVEDWRRFQQEADVEPTSPKAKRNANVPFPVAQAAREPGHRPTGTMDRRRSSQLLPPS